MQPRKIAYIIWTIIALLGGICWIMPEGGWGIGTYTLRFPSLLEVLDMQDNSSGMIDSTMLADLETMDVDTVTVIQDSIPVADTVSKPAEVKVPAVAIANIDTRAYLSAFYNALDSVSQMPVRVVHYGDSQIEEDRITNVLREQWQEQYGGGGVGVIPLHQTIPTRTIRQRLSMNGVVQSTQGGPKRCLVYGPRSMRLVDSDDYGVMGQVAVLDSTLVDGSEDVVLTIEPIDKKRKSYHYFSRVRVLTDSIRVNNLEIGIKNLELDDSTTHCELRLQGRGHVYGISVETPTGVIVDNIPMRGCSGNIFTKIDSTQLSEFFRETNTRLIILQFGGNMIPQTENPSTINGYVRSTLRQQVRYIRACAPYASILFVGPSDMSTNIDGVMTTYPLVPYMDKLLKRMAEEEGIAYWSMYDAMGGYNSMVAWHDKGLAGSDYVHFTRAGANNIGKKLYKWIMESKQ